MKTYTLHINGMHCIACASVIENKLQEITYVTKVNSSFKTSSVEITGYFGNKSPEKIAEELSILLHKKGYTLSVEKQKRDKKLSEFKIALPMAILFILLFILLQRLGIINLINGGNISYGTAFLIGIVASLSTCMAVVGGLVLSMSATFAKEGDKIRPQILFHFGRLISFFILGGVIGALGSAFTLSTTATFILYIIIAIVMLILGVNLLDVFHFTKSLQLIIPKSFAKSVPSIIKINHTFTPFLIGVSTFFLPCGFTQSMQVFTLSTGSFLRGGFIMLAFALGTLPILALLSFSSFSIQKSSKSGIFFKTVGLIVILFALFNIINSLVIIDVIPPIFNF